jgi:8-oxo-dGTP pyrophosphatase MutT (NUDIX family)
MSKINYVIVVALSIDGQKVILLTKDKGPAQLIGKITFPGGKIDPEDFHGSIAAARELNEETGINVTGDDMIFIKRREGEWGSIESYLVVCDISNAKTMETEVVSIADVVDTLVRAKETPDLYAPDFMELFTQALDIFPSYRLFFTQA